MGYERNILLRETSSAFHSIASLLDIIDLPTPGLPIIKKQVGLDLRNLRSTWNVQYKSNFVSFLK